jgi:nucleotide-binding universal stress UspA family protein
MPKLTDLRALLDVRQILVPCDGSLASYEALAQAINVAKRNRGSVVVVHVIEVKRTLPLDADMTDEAQRGEEVLSESERLAAELDFHLDGELLQAREAGHAIVDEALERRVDAIVLGTEYKRPFGEFQLSRTIQYVMKHAPCQVWVYRMPARTEERDAPADGGPA